MKLSLYQIEKDYIALAEQLIEAGGEVTEELEKALAINQQNLETKGTNYGFVVKQMENEIEIIDAEIARLTALKKSRNKSIERLKETLSNAMEIYGVEEIKTPVLKINFRKSESVEIVSESQLDMIYFVEKKSFIPDKAMIKEALKQGHKVEGAVLKTNKNLQIK